MVASLGAVVESQGWSLNAVLGVVAGDRVDLPAVVDVLHGPSRGGAADRERVFPLIGARPV